MASQNCLASDCYDGDIGRVNIRWSDGAREHLKGRADDNEMTESDMKAVTEHFAFNCGARIGAQRIKIKGPPHIFTTDSRTGQKTEDAEHLTAEIKTTERTYICHVYLGGMAGKGATRYQAAYTVGESVVKKNSSKQDKKLSWGHTSFGSEGGRGESSSASGAGQSTAGGSSAQDGNYSEWELDTTHNRYRRYNYDTKQWEWY